MNVAMRNTSEMHIVWGKHEKSKHSEKKSEPQLVFKETGVHNFSTEFLYKESPASKIVVL